MNDLLVRCCHLVLVSSIVVVVACGDDDGPTDAGSGVVDGGGAAGGAAKPTGGGIFKAVIDGTPWEATPASARARVEDDVPGGFNLRGSAGLTQLQLNLFYVDAPGSYLIGVGGSVVGASGSVSRGTAIWQSPASGTAGVLEVTELRADRIVATFEMTGTAVPGSSAMGTVAVTEGELDLPIAEEPRAIGPAHGRSLSAKIDGAIFHAATVVVTPNPGGISFNALNDNYNFGFILSEVDAVGTYMLTLDPPARAVAVVAGDSKWLSPQGDAGSITFTTLSADRLVGTFEVTVEPQADSAATRALVVTEGSFDIGREEP